MITVLRRRDFPLLWIAGLISLTGDWMLAVALPVAVYELTGSALATGGVLIANKVSSLLLASIAGVFVDRWNRQRTMVVANLIRAPLLLGLLAINSADRVWIVYVVSASLSAVGQFFRPAENALLPRLVANDELVPANALNALNDNLSRLIGPALGGLIAVWVGLDGVALVDAASYLISALMIAAISVPDGAAAHPAPASSTTARRTALWHDWLGGLRLIGGSPVLRIVTIVFAIASLGEGVMQTAFWVFIDEELGGSSLEAGWLLSAQAIGGLAGASLVGVWGKRSSPLFLLGVGSLGIGLVDLALFNYAALVSGIWIGVILMALDGVPASAFGTGYAATIQTEAEDAYRGRVYGALAAVSALFMITGAAIAGLATERFGPVAVLTMDSLGYAIAGMIALRFIATGITPGVRTVTPRPPGAHPPA